MGIKIILLVDKRNAPYVETKPIHQSQQITIRNWDGSIIVRIDVVLNFELKRKILGLENQLKF